jgi:ribose 5-phosphate isomerase B
MRIALGCDHAGFPLKGELRTAIEAAGHTIVDCGTFDTAQCDYPDVARSVAEAIRAGPAERGVLVCGSGVGAAVAATKIRGIRAGVCHDCYSARQGVEHDDLNVLCLGARVVGPALATDLVRTFLGATFSGEERHVRRLRKVGDIERELTETAAGQTTDRVSSSGD